MKRVQIVILACLFSVPVASAQESGATVARGPGGSIQTELGYGIVLNKDSTLEREWIVINDAALPVQFAGNAVGLTTVYSSNDRAYRYMADFNVLVAEPISALEIRFIAFDIWGNHVRNYVITAIADLEPGQREISATWRALSENEVAEFYASIAYISRVRTSSGQVIEANQEPALIEAQRFSESFTNSDLSLNE